MGKINVYDNVMIEKRKYGNQRNFYRNHHLIDRRFRNGIYSLLSLADARGSADIIYLM